ncbi:MAG: hypothetical protein MI674_01585 [Cytophagales bacterium]|nr:hypothetical protein [Cytophagales bacterium]
MPQDKKWSLRISTPGTKKIKLIVHDQGLARKEKDFTLVVKTRKEVDTERESLSEIIQEGKGNILKRVRDVLASQNDAQARFTMVHGTAKDDIAPLVAALNLEAEQSKALVTIFLENGLHPDSPVSNGQKLLEYAFEKEDEALMGMLLAKGADPHVTKADGLKSLFDWTIEENKLSLVKQLIQTGKVKPSCEAVYQTAQKGNKEMLKHFKHHGFIDVADEDENTALTRAFNEREKKTFEVLLQQGADPTIKNQKGKRVLLTKAINKKSLEFLAGILDRQTLVAIFLENGADSLVSDGQKLLEYALEKEDETLIGMLLDKGADPRVTKAEGNDTKSLFDWAVENNKLNLVKQILETGKVELSYDALCKAAQKGNKEVLKHLRYLLIRRHCSPEKCLIVQGIKQSNQGSMLD